MVAEVGSSYAAGASSFFQQFGSGGKTPLFKVSPGGGAVSWASLPEEMCSALHFPPKDPSLGTHLNIQRSYSLGTVWAGASPA